MTQLSQEVLDSIKRQAHSERLMRGCMVAVFMEAIPEDHAVVVPFEDERYLLVNRKNEQVVLKRYDDVLKCEHEDFEIIEYREDKDEQKDKE